MSNTERKFEEMSNPLPEDRQQVIDQINRAFASCTLPQGEEKLESWGGLDADSVMRNWKNQTRASVVDSLTFGSFNSEDLSYMSSDALRYFLPALFELFLRQPRRVADGIAFSELVGRLEGIVGLHEFSDNGFYRPIELTDEQRRAVREFCGQLMTNIKKFYLGDEDDAKFRVRLKAIRKAVLTYQCEEDFDARLREERNRKGPRQQGFRNPRHNDKA